MTLQKIRHLQYYTRGRVEIINYDFFLKESFGQFICDNPELEAQLEVVIRMFARGWYGEIPDNVKDANQMAINRWEGVVYGQYLFPWDDFPGDDICILGELIPDDTIEAEVIFKSDLNNDFHQINGGGE